jgi:hypothetical protein
MLNRIIPKKTCKQRILLYSSTETPKIHIFSFPAPDEGRWSCWRVWDEVKMRQPVSIDIPDTVRLR